MSLQLATVSIPVRERNQPFSICIHFDALQRHGFALVHSNLVSPTFEQGTL
jgi:hypothetical protein